MRLRFTTCLNKRMWMYLISMAFNHHLDSPRRLYKSYHHTNTPTNTPRYCLQVVHDGRGERPFAELHLHDPREEPDAGTLAHRHRKCSNSSGLTVQLAPWLAWTLTSFSSIYLFRVPVSCNLKQFIWFWHFDDIHGLEIKAFIFILKKPVTCVYHCAMVNTVRESLPFRWRLRWSCKASRRSSTWLSWWASAFPLSLRVCSRARFICATRSRTYTGQSRYTGSVQIGRGRRLS